MSKYPDWVYQFREPGTSIKKGENDTYYLYKTKSVRIPGMKNPQPQNEYIGIITPNGVERTGVKKMKTDEVRVYEYGFSYAMKMLLPDKMVRDIGDKQRAESILLHIIQKYSPRSYLLRGAVLPSKGDLHTCVPVQQQKFERLTGLRVEELLPLQWIHLVEIGGRDLISIVKPEQEKILKRIGVAI